MRPTPDPSDRENRVEFVVSDATVASDLEDDSAAPPPERAPGRAGVLARVALAVMTVAVLIYVGDIS